MGVPRRAQLAPGTAVSIVLKQDQRTGKQVQGIVSDILTRGDHHRGVKVRLRDGRVGRAQSLVGSSTSGGDRPSSGGSTSTTGHPPPPWSAPVRDARLDDEYRYDASQSSARPMVSDFLSFPGEGAPPLPQHPPARPTHPPARPTRPEDRLEQSPPYHLHMFDRPASSTEVAQHERQASTSSTIPDSSTADHEQLLLRQEFSELDGALIAAVYHDHGDLTRCCEILEQLCT